MPSSHARDRTDGSCIGRWILHHWATREAQLWALSCKLPTPSSPTEPSPVPTWAWSCTGAAPLLAAKGRRICLSFHWGQRENSVNWLKWWALYGRGPPTGHKRPQCAVFHVRPEKRKHVLMKCVLCTTGCFSQVFAQPPLPPHTSDASTASEGGHA